MAISSHNIQYPSILLDLQYLPCAEYFSVLMRADEIWIEQWEYFEKQTFRNRCQILTSHGIENLVVHVQGGRSKILMKDIKVEYSQDWVRQHWGAMQSSYGKSPFWMYYADYLRMILDKKPAYLFDLNWEILSICLKILKIDTSKIKFTNSFQNTENQNIKNIRGLISPKKSSSVQSFFTAKPYSQTFGNEFVPNLSIIDVLACQGNRTIDFL
jgi:septum formation topological specificity factor MinE